MREWHDLCLFERVKGVSEREEEGELFELIEGALDIVFFVLLFVLVCTVWIYGSMGSVNLRRERGRSCSFSTETWDGDFLSLFFFFFL